MLAALASLISPMVGQSIAARELMEGSVNLAGTNPRSKRKPRKRLKIARGAGSISAKADILQLVRAGRYFDALAMAKDHEQQCGERLFAGAWHQWGEGA